MVIYFKPGRQLSFVSPLCSGILPFVIIGLYLLFAIVIKNISYCEENRENIGKDEGWLWAKSWEVSILRGRSPITISSQNHNRPLKIQKINSFKHAALLLNE